MKVFKFGGASAAQPALMQNILSIVQENNAQLVVISAIGKTTNALEKVVNTAIAGDRALADQLAHELENNHIEYAKSILKGEYFDDLAEKLNELFTELSWALDDAGIQSDDYVYDQIVCIGELASSSILYYYFLQEENNVAWIDIRDVFKTNEDYRHAIIDISKTNELIAQYIQPLIQEGKRVITQGFIGSSSDNNSTTLGREGSDYSASILAAALDAEQVSIWKDVPGFLNADPKHFDATQKLDKISYHEVIELAFYGAQIIHPKTIKPIQNKNIPLYVKSFIDPNLEGTIIGKFEEEIDYPQMMVLKQNQTMIQMTTKDFSFIDEKDLSKVYELCSDLLIKVNLIQHTAISLVIAVNHEDYKIQPLLTALEKQYKIRRNEDLQLLTVRHYDEKWLEEYCRDKNMILEQRTRNTVQILFPA